MEEIPPYARLVSAAVAIVSALGLLLNHFMSQTSVSLGILCIGPLALFLGIGGAIEPKVLWSLGKYGEHLPIKYKIIGGILGGAGVLVTLLLVFVVYPLGR